MIELLGGIICKCIFLIIRFSPPLGSSKIIKTNIFFSKIAKIIFVFIIWLRFYNSQKYLMQILPNERRRFFYQALALQIRVAPIKTQFFPIFLSPSENDSCKARKYKL